MSIFSVGDLVCLKSGSPTMTVEKVEGPFDGRTTDFVKCVWFERIDGTWSGPFNMTFSADAVAPA